MSPNRSGQWTIREKTLKIWHSLLISSHFDMLQGARACSNMTGTWTWWNDFHPLDFSRERPAPPFIAKASFNVVKKYFKSTSVQTTSSHVVSHVKRKNITLFKTTLLPSAS
jgi:hypothetical protein